MATYKETLGNSLIRDDGLSIPKDIKNTDYVAYLRWVALGNTPIPATPAPPAPPRETTKLALYARMTDAELAALNTYLNGTSVRQRRSWDDAVSIYLGQPALITLGATLFGNARAQELLG